MSEVMQISEKSSSFAILYKSFFNFIEIFASKLEPISFDALLDSILILASSLIFFIISHFEEINLSSQLVGIFTKFCKCTLW